MRVLDSPGNRPGNRPCKSSAVTDPMKQLAADFISGEITGYAVVLQFADGRLKIGNHTTTRGYEVLGALDACKFDLNLSLSEM